MSAIWKITPLGGSLYILRSLTNPEYALSVNNTNYYLNKINPGSETDNEKWYIYGINQTSNYVFMNKATGLSITNSTNSNLTKNLYNKIDSSNFLTISNKSISISSSNLSGKITLSINGKYLDYNTLTFITPSSILQGFTNPTLVWNLTSLGNSVYIIRSFYNSNALSVTNGNISVKNTPTGSETNNEKWYIYNSTGGYIITNVGTQKSITNSNSLESSILPTTVISISTAPTSILDNKIFNSFNLSGVTNLIPVTNLNSYLTIANGNNYIQYTASGVTSGPTTGILNNGYIAPPTSFLWNFTLNGTLYTIKQYNTNGYLSALNGKNATINNTLTSTEQWYIYKTPSSGTVFVNAANGLILNNNGTLSTAYSPISCDFVTNLNTLVPATNLNYKCYTVSNGSKYLLAPGSGANLPTFGNSPPSINISNAINAAPIFAFCPNGYNTYYLSYYSVSNACVSNSIGTAMSTGGSYSGKATDIFNVYQTNTGSYVLMIGNNFLSTKGTFQSTITSTELFTLTNVVTLIPNATLPSGVTAFPVPGLLKSVYTISNGTNSLQSPSGSGVNLGTVFTFGATPPVINDSGLNGGSKRPLFYFTSASSSTNNNFFIKSLINTSATVSGYNSPNITANSTAGQVDSVLAYLTSTGGYVLMNPVNKNFLSATGKWVSSISSSEMMNLTWYYYYV